MECSSCGKENETVKERKCGYMDEIHDKKVLEIVCDKCENEHLMDI